MSGNGQYQDAEFVPVQEHLPPPRAPEPAPAQIDYSRMIFTLNEWRKFLNARLLALLALSGSMFGFGFAMYDPTPLRLWAMGIYAVLVQAPVLWLAMRKG